MNKTGLLLSLSVIGIIVVGWLQGWQTALLGLTLIGMLALGVWLWRRSYTIVPELQVAVVFNRELQAFARFLPAGRHLLLPGIEHVENHIPVGAQAAKGTCEAYTRDGHCIEIDWMIFYKLDPFAMASRNRVAMARTLPNRSAGMVDSHTNDCLRELVEAYVVDALLGSGIQGRLKRHLHHAVTGRLQDFGFVIFRVNLTNLRFPAELEQNFRLRHLLNTVRQTTGDLGPEEMERLNQLRPILLKNPNANTSLVYGVIESDDLVMADADSKRNGRTKEKFFNLPLAQ